MLAKNPSVETMLSNPAHNDLQGKCVIPSYTDIEKEIFSHRGFSELEKFGLGLQSRPLTNDEVRVFFSSLSAFVGDIPGGILSLALRITDEYMPSDPLNATGKAAAILAAAVDEYGLHDTNNGIQRTHHQLFIDVIANWGLKPEDLTNEMYIVPAGAALGRRTAEYYRRRSIPEALGFHFASEATSSVEFGWYLQGFEKFKDIYNLEGENDPALTFFVIHTEVEPCHREYGLQTIISHLHSEPKAWREVLSGIKSFMDGYADLFSAVNQRIFGSDLRQFPKAV